MSITYGDFFLHEDLSGYSGKWDALCVLGPTASGKTKFAVDLALRLGRWENGAFVPGAEILSADSRQVYKGMDIGTGKDLGDYRVNLGAYVERCAEKGNSPLWGGLPGDFRGKGLDKVWVDVPCHLLDRVEAGTKYNIFEYQRDFARAYAGVLERGRVPVICGGSGLYIEAATRGYELHEVVPDNRLRQRLEEEEMGVLIDICTWLKTTKGAAPHNNTDFDTKKRVIRAIEIELAGFEAKNGPEQLFRAFQADDRRLLGPETGKPEKISGNGVREGVGGKLPQRCRYIGILVDRETRNARIDARLEARLQEGMLDEVKQLLERGIAPEDLIYYGLEYKFVTQYLTGVLGYEEMVEKLGTAIHQFAKRQMTWFRGMERRGIEIEWVIPG